MLNICIFMKVRDKTHTCNIVVRYSRGKALYGFLIYLFCSDFTVSDEARIKVEQSQWTITQALRYLLHKSHPRPDITFAHCVRAITENRTHSVYSPQVESHIYVDWGDVVEIPPLLMELLPT